jgi:acyl-CoA synthetase (NDP forming)
MECKHPLDYIFHPKSIGVAGVSNDASNTGQMLLQPLITSGFKGEIYAINPKAKEALGLKCYPSINNIPGPVDYVIVSIPARLTPKLLEDCVVKGVKVAALFTAGFSESGDEGGQQLEDHIVQIARQGGMRIIGPNCLGIYCPATGLSLHPDLPQQSGPVGFICQSGGNTHYMTQAGATRGIRFSKVISYGNACDLNESDFIEYFTDDPETEIITAYIEGTKDGARFFKALHKAVKAKPVIIFKGGYTEAGIAGVASHTGALAGSEAVWEGLFKQTGVIRAYSLDELIDIALPFLYMPPPQGRNVGIIGLGGGASVQAADECTTAGLSVPPLPQGVRDILKKFTTSAGNIFRNPVDTQSFFIGPQEYLKTVETVANWEGIDLLILHIAPDALVIPGISQELIGIWIEVIVNAAKQCSKPVAVVLHSFGGAKSWELLSSWQEQCYQAGLATFPTVKRAANAISKFIQYHEVREAFYG